MERRVRALLEWRSPCGGNETVCRGYGEAVRLACQVAAMSANGTKRGTGTGYPGAISIWET